MKFECSTIGSIIIGLIIFGIFSNFGLYYSLLALSLTGALS